MALNYQDVTEPGRLPDILRQESGQAVLHPDQTVGEIFKGNRAGFATALVRLEIASGNPIPDNVEQMTIGDLLNRIAA